jgi:plasmid stabilization system protein ParE
MSFIVHIIGGAEKDLYEIYDYVRKSGSPINAQKLFLRLEQTCMSLADNPEQGHISPELERIGVYEYRITLKYTESSIKLSIMTCLFIASWTAGGICRNC